MRGIFLPFFVLFLRQNAQLSPYFSVFLLATAQQSQLVEGHGAGGGHI